MKYLFPQYLDVNNYEDVKKYFLSLNKIVKIDGLINNVGIAGPTKFLMGYLFFYES